MPSGSLLTRAERSFAKRITSHQSGAVLCQAEHFSPERSGPLPSGAFLSKAERSFAKRSISRQSGAVLRKADDFSPERSGSLPSRTTSTGAERSFAKPTTSRQSGAVLRKADDFSPERMVLCQADHFSPEWSGPLPSGAFLARAERPFAKRIISRQSGAVLLKISLNSLLSLKHRKYHLQLLVMNLKK